MPSQSFVNVTAAGGTTQNLMTGSQFEFPGRPTRVQVYAGRDDGGAAGVGNIEVFFGQELEYANSPLSNLAVDGAAPAVPDNLLVDDIAAPGDRIVIRIAETGAAAALTVRALVVLTPVA